MKSELRFQLLVAVLAVAANMFAGYAVSQTAPHSLASPESFASISDTDARSAAMFTELGRVLTHPRCTNCHPASAAGHARC
jgi:cytochrome c5